MFAEMSRLHVRYKAAAWLRGFIDSPLMRPPMPRPRPEEVGSLYSLLHGASVSVIDRAKVDEPLATLGAAATAALV